MRISPVSSVVALFLHSIIHLCCINSLAAEAVLGVWGVNELLQWGDVTGFIVT